MDVVPVLKDPTGEGCTLLCNLCAGLLFQEASKPRTLRPTSFSCYQFRCKCGPSILLGAAGILRGVGVGIRNLVPSLKTHRGGGGKVVLELFVWKVIQ